MDNVARLEPRAFADLPGWSDDQHALAFAAFRRSARAMAGQAPKTRALGVDGSALLPLAGQALAMPEAIDNDEARRFFEAGFRAVEVLPTEGSGFVTGYYEPVVPASPVRSTGFPVPLYARPDDLTEIGPDDDRSDLEPGLTWARRRPDGRLEAFPDRAAIMAGALAGRVPVIAWLSDWVEAFFIHVQGSARLEMTDGTVRRVTFAGKSGHPYFPIARVLVEKGLMSAAEATADVLRDHLLTHPQEAPAIMARNRSFIFFREAGVPDPALGPVAAAGVALTPGRSLAVDRHLHTFHVPVHVVADLGGEGPFRRLMIAQDTGSAILGPARGDLFFGSGAAAWQLAARIRHAARFFLLLPGEGGLGS